MLGVNRFRGYVVAVDPMENAPDGSCKRAKVRVTDEGVHCGCNFVVNNLPVEFSLQSGQDVSFALASFNGKLKAIDVELISF